MQLTSYAIVLSALLGPLLTLCAPEIQDGHAEDMEIDVAHNLDSDFWLDKSTDDNGGCRTLYSDMNEAYAETFEMADAAWEALELLTYPRPSRDDPYYADESKERSKELLEDFEEWSYYAALYKTLFNSARPDIDDFRKGMMSAADLDDDDEGPEDEWTEAHRHRKFYEIRDLQSKSPLHAQNMVSRQI